MLYQILVTIYLLITINDVQGSRIVGRIVGGVATTINELPYQVSLWNGTAHFCGGALLSDEWIITAAHCMGKMAAYKIRVNSTVSDNGGTLLDVIADFKHPLFNEAYSYDYDVALVKVKKSDLSGNSFIKWPDCNEKKCIDQVDNKVQVSGWGTNNIVNKADSVVLQKVSVPIVDLNQCKNIYKDDTEVTNRMFCAGYINEGGKDSCQGDSGGPVTCNNNLVGVVSAGTEKCALAGSPGLYTDLINDNIQKWIHEKTGLGSICSKQNEPPQTATPREEASAPSSKATPPSPPPPPPAPAPAPAPAPEPAPAPVVDERRYNDRHHGYRRGGFQRGQHRNRRFK